MSFVHFHQKAICSLPEEFYQAKPELSHFFQGSHGGLVSEELMASAEDCIRFMIEDCDYLGEFQLMVDAASALGGFACKIAEQLLVDEYPKVFIKTLASFENCMDFEFNAEAVPRPLVATSLAALAKVSSQVIPLFLGSTKTRHQLCDEPQDLSRALDASVVTAAAMDVLATRGLTGELKFYEEKLADLRICTPIHGMKERPLFTSLATGRQAVVQEWEAMGPIKRLNHTEATYPGQVRSASDLPIYSPNFLYTGYQQQASSAVALLDMHSAELSTHIHSTLIKDLCKRDFVGLGANEDAFDIFTDIQEALFSLVELEE